MKDVKTQMEFVQLRADGCSYRAIGARLGISRDTCSRWDVKFAQSISQARAERLAEIQDEYEMSKIARIKRLGGTLAKIDAALDEMDLSGVAPEKLLEIRLKYADALRAEYAPPGGPIFTGKELDARAVLSAFGDLAERLRAGDVATAQAAQEGAVLGKMLHAVEAVTIRQRVDELEGLLLNEGEG